jgi:translation initiation factor 1
VVADGCSFPPAARTEPPGTYDRDVSNSRLVYSTDGGDRRRAERERPEPSGPGDGVVRVAREKSGRGKVVTVVRGLPPADLKAVATELKRLCGSGGSVKDGAVELQGDHEAKVVTHLEARGLRVR